MWDFYWAGALFSQAEKDFNLHCATQLRSLGLKIFLPQRDNRYEDVGGQLCFQDNVDNLENSNGVIAVVDGPDVDSGTAWEVGYYSAMINFGKRPSGDIYLLRTDFRECADGAYGVNLMVSESITIPVIFRSFDELFQHIISFKVKQNKEG
jgi:hypothetical protein